MCGKFSSFSCFLFPLFQAEHSRFQRSMMMTSSESPLLQADVETFYMMEFLKAAVLPIGGGSCQSGQDIFGKHEHVWCWFPGRAGLMLPGWWVLP